MKTLLREVGCMAVVLGGFAAIVAAAYAIALYVVDRAPWLLGIIG